MVQLSVRVIVGWPIFLCATTSLRAQTAVEIDLEENLFLRRCITSCASTGPTDYTTDICHAIPRRMAASACQNITQLRYSIQSVSELQSLCSAERRSVVIGANRNLHFCDETIDLPTHA